MKKFMIVSYGLLSYLIFFATFLYLIGFTGNLVVPKGIDSGAPVSFLNALLVNLGLILLFGLQHSIMARQGFKRWLKRYLPAAIERSTFVLFSSGVFLLVMGWWQPMPQAVWAIENVIGQAVMWSVFALGWIILLISTFLINHFHLFGLQQVYQQLRNQPPSTPRFRTPFLYGLVRHPMMLGILLGIWFTPRLTVGHLLFAGGMTVYILIGLHYEERELVGEFGEVYQQYRKSTPRLIPLAKRQL